ncbi:sigma factor-like helix-turn-helix DNA-binding protein [Peptococcaceae bacterium 1198_IL3148]
MNKKEQIRLIEVHLRNYKTYLVGKKNIQQSLDEILPNITTNYSWPEGTNGSFNINSSTEDVVLDRITGSRAIYLREMLNTYNTIINSINDAVDALDDDEKDFIKYRYFEGWSIEKTAQQLGYSEQNCFKIRIQALDKLLISLTNLLKMTDEI